MFPLMLLNSCVGLACDGLEQDLKPQYQVGLIGFVMEAK